MRCTPTGGMRSRHRRITRAAVIAALAAAIIGAAAVPAAAAEPAAPVLAAPGSLSAVITNLRNWLVGLLVALATLFLTVGGVRYMLAGGDPGEVSKARDTLKYALLGYALAALAPLVVSVLQRVVGA